MRAKSEYEKQKKSMSTMDVNASAVTALFRSCRAGLLIHGHTHLPGTHELTVDSRRCVRRVLPDWYERANGLSCDDSGIHTVEF